VLVKIADRTKCVDPIDVPITSFHTLEEMTDLVEDVAPYFLLFSFASSTEDAAAIGTYRALGRVLSWYNITVTLRASLPDSAATTPPVL